MKPLSSIFGLNLQTTVKIVCKSLLFFVTLSMTVNILNLDYEGPRQESIVALGVTLLFFILLTGSAFTGHSGADREELWLVVASLGFLTLAVVHWLVLGLISMQKGDPTSIWRVCLQSRCAETLWTLDCGYRIAPLVNKKAAPGNAIERKEVHLSPASTGFESQELHQEYDRSRGNGLIGDDVDDYKEEEVETHGKNGGVPQTRRPIEFWKRFTNPDFASNDPSSTVSLLVTLMFFLIFFVYFCTCVMFICSYSSELYDEYRLGHLNEESEENSS